MKPAAAKNVASASVETVMVRFWPPVCSSAPSTGLCVLTCGRSCTPRARARSSMRSQLACTTERRTTAHGVRSEASERGWAAMAGGGPL